MNKVLKTRFFRFPLYLLVWTNICVFTNGQGGSWTIWYNEELVDYGDNNSLDQIHKSGKVVCGEDKPEIAECRIVGQSATFTESNARDVAPDYLFTPCTTNGIVCFNDDQRLGKTCRDYEVRFFCPYKEDEAPEGDHTTNYGLVALAAGMSVLIPLLCVVALQCVKQFREKRLLNRRHEAAREHFAGLTSEPVDPGSFTAPPTYESLFNSSSGNVGTDALLQENRTQSSTVDLSHINQGFSHEDSENTGIYQISSGTVLPRSNNSTDSRTDNNTTNISRFPGMHLSVQDIILLSGGDQRTPPPAYDDAMVILGPIPPKYSDVQCENRNH